MKLKRFMKIAVAVVLFGSLTIEAQPIINWIFQQQRFYVNGNPQDADDTWTWTRACNNTPDELGPPYEVEFDQPNGPDADNYTDMAPVHNGVIGTYWCGLRTHSSKYNSFSDWAATEKSFTVTAQETGFVPMTPTW